MQTFSMTKQNYPMIMYALVQNNDQLTLHFYLEVPLKSTTYARNQVCCEKITGK
jgi:hypothetical protein